MEGRGSKTCHIVSNERMQQSQQLLCQKKSFSTKHHLALMAYMTAKIMQLGLFSTFRE